MMTVIAEYTTVYIIAALILEDFMFECFYLHTQSNMADTWW